jgi:hypothetical protein
MGDAPEVIRSSGKVKGAALDPEEHKKPKSARSHNLLGSSGEVQSS